MLRNTFVSFFVYWFCCHSSMATMFIPLPIDKQVDEATSAVEAKLSSSRVFKNESGQTVTEYSFDVLKSYNFSSNESENKQLKLTMLGGTYNGITSKIDGAPQFNENEKTFLLLKTVDSKIYLSNFTLGKYKIQEIDGKTYYVSEVFPLNPQIGRITQNKMIELMEKKWKVSFDVSNKAIRNSEVLEGATVNSASARILSLEKRAPAQDMKAQQHVPVFFWSALFILLFFFSIIFIKLGKSERHHKSN